MWQKLFLCLLVLGLIGMAAQTLTLILPFILGGGIIYALIVNPQLTLGTATMLVIALALYRFPWLVPLGLLICIGIGLMVMLTDKHSS